MADENKKIKLVPNKPRPHTWCTGPDPLKHDMYNPFLKRKAQAKFRDEVWDLTFDQFYDLWKDYWHMRGKKSDEYCMTRIDNKGAWDINNAKIITRKEHCVKTAAAQIGMKYKGK